MFLYISFSQGKDLKGSLSPIVLTLATALFTLFTLE